MKARRHTPDQIIRKLAEGKNSWLRAKTWPRWLATWR